MDPITTTILSIAGPVALVAGGIILLVWADATAALARCSREADDLDVKNAKLTNELAEAKSLAATYQQLWQKEQQRKRPVKSAIVLVFPRRQSAEPATLGEPNQ